MTDIAFDNAAIGVTAAHKPPRAWNARTKRWFLELLIELSSVRDALAAMGASACALYVTRKTCKKFREAWDEVTEFLYARLEADLFDRAINGEDHEVIRPSGEKMTIRKVASALGLALLRLNAPRIAQIRALHGPDAEDDAMQAKMEIIKKLDMLARHKARKAAAEAAAQAAPPI